MPNNIVFSNPGGSVIRWGNGAATPYLTLSGLPSTGTVGVAVSGLVTNPSAATATWTVSSSPADAIITPSSGTLAPGVAVAFTLTALASGLKNVQLTSTTPNTIISGSPHSFTAASVAPPPPPPAPAASALTLSMASTGTTGSATLVTVTPNAAIGATGTATLSVSGGGTLGTSTLNFTAGSSAAQSTTLTRTTDGLSTVTLTNNMGLTNAGTPANFASSTPIAVGSGGGTASFSVSSTTGATLAPFTIGMPLKEGQFPSGVSVSGVVGGQASVRNTWPDGSAKFAIVSGRATVAAGSSIVATLQRGSTTGTALAESDLTATGVTATLQFAGGTVMSLASLIGVTAVGASNGVITGGRVRTLTSGPTMSSWLYCAPLSAGNAHIVGWMEVRLYVGGHVHVLPWVENGWTRVSSCAGQAGTLTFTLGGTTRFTQADVHLANHCRVVAQDVAGCGYWLGTAPDLYCAPDPLYLQRTGLVPSYSADTSAATTLLNNLAQTYSPTNYGQLSTSARNVDGDATDNGDFDARMSSGGYHQGIGPLPEWDVQYLTSSADQRAWKAVIANAMGYGRYSVHFRDENTLRPVSPADAANKTLPQGSNHNIADVGANQFGGSETLPTVAGYDTGSGIIKPEYWAQTHHPSAGFMAYLLTGHEFFLELNQFVAGTCFLRQNNLMREYGLGLQKTHMETVRGQAWALRSIFQAATISVDGSAIQTGFVTIAQNNIAYYLANYITSPCAALGIPRPYSNAFNPGAAPYRVNAWELDFSISAWGYGLAMKPPVGTTPLANMASYFAWHAQFVVGRLGALSDANSYGFNSAARANSFAIANTSTDAPWVGNVGPFITSWGDHFSLTYDGVSNSTNGTNTIGAFDSNNGSFPDATSYWGNLQSALAYAVEHGVSGAWDGYLRMVRASNWSGFDTSANTYPVWSLRSQYSPPAWAGDVATNTFSTISGTQFYSWGTSNITGGAFRGTDPIGAIVDSFNDPAFDPVTQKFHFHGGGHGDGSCNGVYTCDARTFGYSTAVAATPAANYLPQYMTSAPGATINYPSGVQFSGPNFASWFLTTAEGLNATTDAGYIAPQLARVVSHQYAAAAIRQGVVYYFYGNYAEANTATGTWAGRGTDLGAQLVTFRPQYNNVPLQVGTTAVYDDVTDRFFVSLVPGDSGGGWRSGVLVFNPNTRTIDAVLESNDSTFGLFLLANQAVKVGRKIYWFLSSAAAQTTVDRGFIMDMDQAATKTGLQGMSDTYCQKFTLTGDAAWSTPLGSDQETIPAYYDGTAIRRWNHNATHRGFIVNVNLTPASGLGTVASPYVLTQTRTAISGTAPSSVKFVYSRLVYLPSARAAVCIPNARSDWFALRVA